jgi:hypothetical protein
VKAITITQAGVTLVKTLASDYATIYTFGTHLYKVRDLVRKQMSLYIADAKANDTCVAYAHVQVLATMCTIANMQALLDGQVAINSTPLLAPYIIKNGKLQPLGPRDYTNRYTIGPMGTTVIPVQVR